MPFHVAIDVLRLGVIQLDPQRERSVQVVRAYTDLLHRHTAAHDRGSRRKRTGFRRKSFPVSRCSAVDIDKVTATITVVRYVDVATLIPFMIPVTCRTARILTNHDHTVVPRVTAAHRAYKHIAARLRGVHRHPFVVRGVGTLEEIKEQLGIIVLPIEFLISLFGGTLVGVEIHLFACCVHTCIHAQRHAHQ